MFPTDTINMHFFANTKKRIFTFCAALAFCALSGGLHAGIDPQKIAVLANSDIEKSTALACEYAKSRGIPPKNVIAIPLGKAPLVSREFYDKNLAAVLIEKLSECELVESEKKVPNPECGNDFVTTKFDVDFLVICKGVPHGIESTNPLVTQKRGGKIGIDTDAASVDNELVMLFQNEYRLASAKKNPLFKNPSDNAHKVMMLMRTSRLDGLDYNSAAGVFKSAIEAESKGLMGRVYIDKAQKIGGDAWLQSCADKAEELGFDTSVDENKALLGYFDRRDGLAVYFGWYAPHPSEYFADKNLRFASGAVGWHIYSFSALSMNSPLEWTPALVERGMGATVGNVYEPYLTMTHRPDIFFSALASGKTAGEAAYEALPSLSWQTLLVADPLYKPFKTTLDEQIARIDSGNFTAAHVYALIRKINLIEREGGAQKALDYALKYSSKFLSLPFRYRLAQLYEKLGKNAQAADCVTPFFISCDFSLEDETLAMDIAKNFLYPKGLFGQCVALGRAAHAKYAKNKVYLEAVLPFFIAAAKNANLQSDADAFTRTYESVKAERLARQAAERAKREAAKKAAEQNARNK